MQKFVVGEPRNPVRSPYERIVMKTIGRIKVQWYAERSASIAFGVIRYVHGLRTRADKLEVDFVVRLILGRPDVGEKC